VKREVPRGTMGMKSEEKMQWPITGRVIAHLKAVGSILPVYTGASSDDPPSRSNLS
jgi:hypothetical protein